MATHTATSIEETPENLRIVMPVPRVGCVAVFLSVWLTGWLVGELSAVGALFTMDSLLNPAALFLIVWVTGWTAGGIMAGSALAMMLSGQEVVTFTPEEINRRAEAFGRGLNWRYVMSDVTNLRQTPDENGVKDFISFDYHGKTVRFGTGLNETEAERATEAVWARFPQLMPRVERVRREESLKATGSDAVVAAREAPPGVDWA